MMAELSLLVKATIVLAAALLGTRLLRRARASVRALLLASAFGVLLALPVASLLIPARTIEVPVAYADSFPLVLEQVETSTPVLPARAEAPVAARWRIPSITTVLRAAWTLIALGLLLRLVIALWRLRGIRRTGVPWLEGADVVNRLAASVGVRRHVDVFLHEDLSAPMTFGAGRPAIGLPMDAPHWDHTALHHALVHELEHVRRGDWTICLAVRLGCALYWFHPLAWIAARQLCLESERACDDAVLRDAEGTAYAEQLVSLARRLTKRSPVAVLSMAARSDLSTRVRAVLDPHQPRGRPGFRLAAGSVAIAVVAVWIVSPLRAVAPQDPVVRRPPPGAPQGLDAMIESPTTGPNAPRFEAASVKRNTNSRTGPGGGMFLATGQLRTTNSSLVTLLRMAYGLRMTDRIVGAPSWAETDGFDVDARPEGRVSVEQARLMLRTLLADRFELAVRREPRDMPVYALTLARSDGRLGPQLARPVGDCVMVVPSFAQPPAAGGVNPPDSGKLGPQPPLGRPGRRCGMGPEGSQTIKGGSVTMASLITLLTPALDRPIVDRTGLTGIFDFDLRYAGAGIGPALAGRGASLSSPDTAPDPAAEAPSIFTALQEQLGLKLEPQRGPVEVLVVERVERPSVDDASDRTPTPAAPVAAQFEVASIRPTPTREIVVRIDTLPGGRFLATNVSTRALIRIAYGAGDFQVVGGPDWLDADRFDINAKADRPLPPMGGPLDGPPEVRLMLQSLLAERFGLALHTETRQLPAYSLVMARSDRTLGRRLTRSSMDCAALTAELAPKGDRPPCGIRAAPGSVVLEGVPMGQLAAVLSGFLNRPVTDNTGLAGNFDLQLSWAMRMPAVQGDASSPGAPPLGPPPLFDALEDQAGLRLERTTGPVEVFVIDGVHRPSEN